MSIALLVNFFYRLHVSCVHPVNLALFSGLKKECKEKETVLNYCRYKANV